MGEYEIKILDELCATYREIAHKAMKDHEKMKKLTKELTSRNATLDEIYAAHAWMVHSPELTVEKILEKIYSAE